MHGALREREADVHFRVVKRATGQGSSTLPARPTESI
jgi:hypothetical protein